MEESLLRQFLHETRGWSRARRGVELGTMVGASLSRLAGIEAGFILYRRRLGHLALHGPEMPNRVEAFAGWGCFGGQEERLTALVQREVGAHLMPAEESWLTPADATWLDAFMARGEVRSVGAWPIMSREQVAGSIVVVRPSPRAYQMPEESVESILDVAAAQIGLALDLITVAHLAEDVSRHDLMTGLYNRRGLESRLARLLRRSREADNVLVVGVLDIDDLKAINDTYGHPRGDHAIREVGAAIERELRAGDLVARFGGDEFVVVALTPSGGDDDAAMMIGIQNQISQETPYRVSLGSACLGADGDNFEELFAVADRRLYLAKRQKKALSGNA